MFNVRDPFRGTASSPRRSSSSSIGLAVVITVLVGLSGHGLSGLIAALRLMAYSPIAGIMVIVCLAVVLVGVIFARIAAEFVLIVFRINEHLGAIRNRGQM
jgi:uncharacterized oligopeptide transporter (OPT) family protein